MPLVICRWNHHFMFRLNLLFSQEKNVFFQFVDKFLENLFNAVFCKKKEKQQKKKKCRRPTRVWSFIVLHCDELLWKFKVLKKYIRTILYWSAFCYYKEYILSCREMMKEKPLRSFSTIRRQTKHNFTTFRYNDDILILGTLK